MKKTTRIMCFVAFILCMFIVNAEATKLRWMASTGDVSGYKIYYGPTDGMFPLNQDVGDVTEYPIEGLFIGEEGDTFYAIVRAYNVTGESGDSNMVMYIIPIITPGTPTDFESAMITPCMVYGVSGHL